ncbi:GNAT family N-acetyltransferase [Aspergillus stella-maris]|uniref:GNAT family N-acetyltransferase n=1 Tax=Aspergillus stella-maris TaxID=1810926 RepID=UPI003CCDB7AD
MELSISLVQPEDVDLLVRKVEYHAHQDNPLYRLMFSRPKGQQWEQSEDEIKWTVDGIIETINRQDETLYKACGGDGLPVGLIGWTTSPGVFAKGMDGENCAKNVTINESEAGQGTKVRSGNRWCPPSLDVAAWLSVSKRLREERQRVLQKYQGYPVCRVTSLAVDPDHQRRGVGSMLIQIFCHYVDENALDAFVLSSPAGHIYQHAEDFGLWYQGIEDISFVKTQGNVWLHINQTRVQQ